MSTIDEFLDIEAVQGDQLIVQKTLLDAAGAPANLTGKTVKFSMRSRGKRTPIVNKAACTIVGAATNGTVLYTGTTSDTAIAGYVEAEFEVTTAGANPQTFPSGREEKMLGYITEQIA